MALDRWGKFGLSNRERQVANLVLQRLSNLEIAYQLNLTEKTIKFHITNIFRKCNLTNQRRRHLIAMVEAM